MIFDYLEVGKHNISDARKTNITNYMNNLILKVFDTLFVQNVVRVMEVTIQRVQLARKTNTNPM